VKTLLVTALFVVIGCGGRVEDSPGAEQPSNVSDTGVADTSPIGASDGGTSGGGPWADASPPTPTDAFPTPTPVDAEPAPDPGDGPTITSIDVCGSAPGVDKIIIHLSEPMAAVADPSAAIQVRPGGTTCPETFDDRSPTGEYAFGAKCGTIDTAQPIVVVIGPGVASAKGVPMTPGSYTFHPTGKPGRLCGNDFR
jgi:hypothetical protein